jgi:hypothetical protein
MPMIDVCVPNDRFPDGVDREVSNDLTLAPLRAEGVQRPAPVQLNNTAACIHCLSPKAVYTAGTASARTARIQVLTPPRAVSRAGQGSFADATAIVARIAGDPTQATRTWVLLAEAVEGAGALRGRVRARGGRGPRTEIAPGGAC